MADQPTNACRVEAAQAGRSVDDGSELADRLSEALADVLEHRPPGLDPICREIALLPGPEAAVRLLAVLADSSTRRTKRR